jgi:hypothetical protein
VDDWDDRVAQATARVENVLSNEMRELTGSMVTKFVVSFEYITPDGERSVASMASPGLMKWDVNGLLTFVMRNDELDSIKQIIDGTEGG